MKLEMQMDPETQGQAKPEKTGKTINLHVDETLQHRLDGVHTRLRADVPSALRHRVTFSDAIRHALDMGCTADENARTGAVAVDSAHDD